MKPTFRKTLMATLVAQACLVQSFAFADQVTPFTLGEITVTSNRPVANGIAEDQVASVVTREEMRAYNRDAVADALNLLSGVTISHGQARLRAQGGSGTGRGWRCDRPEQVIARKQRSVEAARGSAGSTQSHPAKPRHRT